MWIVIGLLILFVIISIPFLAWVSSEIGCGTVIITVAFVVIIAAVAIYYHENIRPLMLFTILDRVLDFVANDLPKCAEGVKGWCLK